MHLKFTFDKKRRVFVCRFRLDQRYTGPPGHCHGGIIATILDEAMGKVNKLREVIALTSQMTVDYLRPVPLHKPLRVESREVSVRGRRHVNMGEILNQKGDVLARGRACSSPSILNIREVHEKVIRKMWARASRPCGGAKLRMIS